MGRHDAVAILEAPSDEAVAKILLALGWGGHIRTGTLKAFSATEYREITQSLG